MRIHATSIVIDGIGVLLTGASGSGKSDLALRMIDRGARLLSDDYTELAVRDGQLLGCPPTALAGKIEVRGVGIIDCDHLPKAMIGLQVRLDAKLERMPEPEIINHLGVNIALCTLCALEASAPLKLEALMTHIFGKPAR